MSFAISLQTTPEPDFVRCFDPDAVGETIRNRCTGTGQALKNDNGSPLDSLPAVERCSELVVLPIATLIMRIAARKQGVEDLSLKTGPPAHEINPRDEVIHLNKWRVQEGRKPIGQSALARGLRTIDTDKAYPANIGALHHLGEYVGKTKHRHGTTIVVDDSTDAAVVKFGRRRRALASSRLR